MTYEVINAADDGAWDAGDNASVLIDRWVAMYPEGAGEPNVKRDWVINDTVGKRIVARLVAISDDKALLIGVDGQRYLLEGIRYVKPDPVNRPHWMTTELTYNGEPRVIDHAKLDL